MYDKNLNPLDELKKIELHKPEQLKYDGSISNRVFDEKKIEFHKPDNFKYDGSISNRIMSRKQKILKDYSKKVMFDVDNSSSECQLRTNSICNFENEVEHEDDKEIEIKFKHNFFPKIKKSKDLLLKEETDNLINRMVNS